MKTEVSAVPKTTCECVWGVLGAAVSVCGFGVPVQVGQFCCVRVNFCSGCTVGGWWHETISVVTNSFVLFDVFNSSLY